MQLKTCLEVDTYDALIFGAPVQAFALSPVMKRYLTQITSLENKKVACLVTQYFRYPWSGGNRAIRQMKKICESKGGEVCGSGIVNWSNLNRDQQIIGVITGLSELF